MVFSPSSGQKSSSGVISLSGVDKKISASQYQSPASHIQSSSSVELVQVPDGQGGFKTVRSVILDTKKCNCYCGIVLGMVKFFLLYQI